MINRKTKTFLLFTLTFVSILYAFNSNKMYAPNKTQGPESGALLLIGGAASATVFFDKFAELAGGKDSKIVIIPTAADDAWLRQDPGFVNHKKMFFDKGFTNVSVLHTRDRTEANNPNFYKELLTASGVWITGGRQWRLVDSYSNTKTLDALKDVLGRGGIISGSSAGATIQGSYLARGDTKSNTIMMGDHEEGFGFITNVAIDQHLLKRNRQFDIFKILDNRQELLGIGLDENAGLLVQGNTCEVIGESYVAIYDGKMWSEDTGEYRNLKKGSREFYFLSPGDHYDLNKRIKM